MALLHFLLIYDHAEGRLLDAVELGTAAREAARAYSEYEEKYRGRSGIEIVLVGADSLETIQMTHAHYFADAADEPFAELLGA